MDHDSEIRDRNKRLVRDALTAVFVDREDDAVARYFCEDYIQHNPRVGAGAGGLAARVREMPPLSVEWGQMVAEGNLVVAHSRWTGFGSPLVVFDMFRIEDGKLAEHWDVMQPEIPASETESGLSMFDPVTY